MQQNIPQKRMFKFLEKAHKNSIKTQGARLAMYGIEHSI
jgi:hypothetical protein